MKKYSRILVLLREKPSDIVYMGMGISFLRVKKKDFLIRLDRGFDSVKV